MFFFVGTFWADTEVRTPLTFVVCGLRGHHLILFWLPWLDTVVEVSVRAMVICCIRDDICAYDINIVIISVVVIDLVDFADFVVFVVAECFLSFVVCCCGCWVSPFAAARSLHHWQLRRKRSGGVWPGTFESWMEVRRSGQVNTIWFLLGRIRWATWKLEFETIVENKGFWVLQVGMGKATQALTNQRWIAAACHVTCDVRWVNFDWMGFLQNICQAGVSSVWVPC